MTTASATTPADDPAPTTAPSPYLSVTAVLTMPGQTWTKDRAATIERIDLPELVALADVAYASATAGIDPAAQRRWGDTSWPASPVYHDWLRPRVDGHTLPGVRVCGMEAALYFNGDGHVRLALDTAEAPTWLLREDGTIPLVVTVNDGVVLDQTAPPRPQPPARQPRPVVLDQGALRAWLLEILPTGVMRAVDLGVAGGSYDATEGELGSWVEILLSNLRDNAFPQVWTTGPTIKGLTATTSCDAEGIADGGVVITIDMGGGVLLSTGHLAQRDLVGGFDHVDDRVDAVLIAMYWVADAINGVVGRYEAAGTMRTAAYRHIPSDNGRDIARAAAYRAMQEASGRYADLCAAEAAILMRRDFPTAVRLNYQVNDPGDLSATVTGIVDADGYYLWSPYSPAEDDVAYDEDLAQGQDPHGEWDNHSRVCDLLAAAARWESCYSGVGLAINMGGELRA